MNIYQFPQRGLPRRVGRSLGLCFTVLALVVQLRAQDLAESSVEHLVQDALAANPELAVYEAAIDAERMSGLEAGLWENPELYFGLGQNKIVGSGGGSWRGHVLSASLAQRIEFPQRVQLRKAIANGNRRLAELGLERFRLLLETRVRLEAYRLLVAEERAATARGIAERSTSLLTQWTQRDPAGVAPLLERRVIEAQVAQWRAEALRREREAQAHRLDLSYLLGRPTDEPVVVAAFTPVLPEAPDDETLLEQARDRNFDLAFHAEEIAQQGYRVRLARTDRLPAITIEPFYERQTGGGNQDIVGLGFSLPLPIWNHKRAAVDAAKARERQLRAAFEVTARQLWRDLVEAASAYRMARVETQLWSPKTMEAFASAATLAGRHFQLGAIDVTTYLELQSQYMGARDALLARREEAFESLLSIEIQIGGSWAVEVE